MFSATAISRTAKANASGRFHHVMCERAGLGVSECTSPTNSASGLALVHRLTTTVTIKLALNAKIAVQKFCAMSLG